MAFQGAQRRGDGRYFACQDRCNDPRREGRCIGSGGRDVGELARSARFEQVATLLAEAGRRGPVCTTASKDTLPTGMLAPLPRAISLSIADQQDLKE